MNALNHTFKNKLKTIRPVLAVLLLCLGTVFPSMAQYNAGEQLGDKAIVSLLTVSPGEEVYAQYGHTAIRVSDPEKNIDLAFNYGLFDFNSPHFIWRFSKGQTDYMVGACTYMSFLMEYQMENRTVTEQVLNLRPQEKQAVWQALAENMKPENRTYRYNFFFNNCSTKPRDILLNAISGKVDYRWKGKFQTLRDEIHFFTDKFPWTQFGIDFVLGSKADNPANLKSQQFAPDLLMESFSKAVIVNDSSQVRPLVLETTQPLICDKTEFGKPLWHPDPVFVMWAVFLLVAGLSALEFRKGKNYYLLDASLFALTGVVGSIIAFMVFFSEHPTTDVNYLLFGLQPFHLVFALGLILPVFRKKVSDYYLGVNFPILAFALAGGLFLPQHFHPAVYPILLSMMLRSGLALFSLQKKRTHA